MFERATQKCHIMKIRITCLVILVVVLSIAGFQCNKPTAPDTDTSDTTPPTIPTDLTATVVSYRHIDLYWTASIDNSGTVSYRIFRNATDIGISHTTSYSDTNLTSNTNYCYTIRAFDGAGNLSDIMSERCINTPDAPDTIPPSAPVNLFANPVDDTSIELNWNDSLDNIGVAGYRIYRNGDMVGTSTASTFTDSGLDPETEYRYTVRAFDEAGNVSDASAEASAITGATKYDVDSLGIPRFVTASYINLDAIGRISRFRSAVGHDYSDEFESCRSMKHYFEPTDWTRAVVFSPVEGTISGIEYEWAGAKISIRSTAYTAITFTIFHATPLDQLAIGVTVTAGQEIGAHIGQQTMSDIAVSVNTPGGWKLISYFDVLTDEGFAPFRQRGVPSREAAIITREERDANPLSCRGEAFTEYGTIEDWINLQ